MLSARISRLLRYKQRLYPKSKPILEKVKTWLDKKSLQTPPKGLLGQAVSYTLKQWNRLICYLEDGHLQPDNNAVENCITPFVVGRKIDYSQEPRKEPVSSYIAFIALLRLPRPMAWNRSVIWAYL